MTNVKTPKTFSGRVIEDPPLARFLFSDVRFSWVWLVVRIWLGYQWIQASLHKIADPGWVQTGEALKAYWVSAVKVGANGKAAVGYDWYGGFLNSLINAQAYTWFGKLIAYGELLVGIGLVVGAFVGIAAFFGALMNWNFVMAGSASTNGFMLVIAILLVVAWKTAGYIGADYFLLRWLGVPWKPSEEVPATPQVKPATTGR
jgi:thiosulfate dehydrogenase [quinone] large subunit